VSFFTNGQEFCPVTDTDLQGYLKLRAEDNVDTMTVELKPAQKPFSDYTSIPEVCSIYGIPEKIPTFDCALRENESLDEVSKVALGNLIINLKRSGQYHFFQ